jgi:hypothetical protein
MKYTITKYTDEELKEVVKPGFIKGKIFDNGKRTIKKNI